ncbi:MAG TPA: zinc-ribbon domain containing protein, partial [Oligoflexia bacterium]|nr:zinc-ribbon domain containing protein [Oligoflexia bacterium]
MNRFCQDCSAAFEVSAGDLEFYDRISPEINGRVAVIPPPARCPDCRQRRRLLWRNERHLYPDTCDLCGKSILSLYSPDKHQPVYCHECWWSDGWDAAAYGRNFDFSKSFSEQFRALQQDVPRLQ